MTKEYKYTAPNGAMVSRQRLWQMKKRAKGCCEQCGKKSDGNFSGICLDCIIAKRENERKHRGYQRRNLNAKSYLLRP